MALFTKYEVVTNIRRTTTAWKIKMDIQIEIRGNAHAAIHLRTINQFLKLVYFHLRELSNHTMDAMISTSSNANPSTASDVRSCPISNNSGLYIQMLLMYWSKIWRKKIQFGVRPLLIVSVQLQGRFLWKKIAMEIA